MYIDHLQNTNTRVLTRKSQLFKNNAISLFSIQIPPCLPEGLQKVKKNLPNHTLKKILKPSQTIFKMSLELYHLYTICSYCSFSLPTHLHDIDKAEFYLFLQGTGKFPFLFLDCSASQRSFSLLSTKQLVSVTCIGYLQCYNSTFFSSENN